MREIITNARVLGPDGTLSRVSVTLDGRQIRALGERPGRGDTILDARDLLLLPGIVDLHGDAFERQLMPRPRVHVTAAIGLIDSDRQLLANGITTAYHGVTLSWEPGLRGLPAAHALLDALAAVKPRLGCDTRVHLRWEMFALDAVEDVIGWIGDGRIDLLAFNEHTGDIGRHVAAGKLGSYLGRTGLDAADFTALFAAVTARAGSVPVAAERIAAVARARGIPMASHDDDGVATRARFRALGCRMSEFPLDAATARAALAAGDVVLLGGPNVIRGGSHAGRLDATAAVRDGLCSVLTSDYYYPSPLQAAFALVRQGAASLGAAWDLVAAKPAAAVGLDDRGVIAPGRRADLVLVDDRDPGLPTVAATIAAGRLVHAGPSLVAHGLGLTAEPTGV